MASWSTDDLVGPDGEDWRVPVSELESRIQDLSNRLSDAKIPGVLIQNPVDRIYALARLIKSQKIFLRDLKMLL